VIRHGTVFSADLGGSSNYSSEKKKKESLKAEAGEGFHMNSKWI